MSRKRVAIACQGGGSQCAFVAGALKTVLSQRVQDRFQIVGLSGTSGGALTAALAWVGLLKQAHGRPTVIEEPIVAFWKDLQEGALIQAKAFVANLLREERSSEQTAPEVSVEGVNGSRRSTQA